MVGSNSFALGPLGNGAIAPSPTSANSTLDTQLLSHSNHWRSLSKAIAFAIAAYAQKLAR